MKKYFGVLLLILVFTSSYGQSSSNSKQRFGEKLFTGGNLGLNFGNITYLEIAPIAGYRFSDVFAAGVGGKYQFYKDNTISPSIKTDIYGGSVFGRIYIISNLFLHAEYEVLSMETDIWDPYNTFYHGKRFLIGSALAGAGYRQAIGERAYTNIMVLYNFNETIFSPYTNPVLKFGLEIGL